LSVRLKADRYSIFSVPLHAVENTVLVSEPATPECVLLRPIVTCGSPKVLEVGVHCPSKAGLRCLGQANL